MKKSPFYNDSQPKIYHLVNDRTILTLPPGTYDKELSFTFQFSGHLDYDGIRLALVERCQEEDIPSELYDHLQQVLICLNDYEVVL